MHDTHPGSALKQLIDGKGITVKQAASEIGVSHVMLYNIINAKSAISPSVAALIELWNGNMAADAWLVMQGKYDLIEAREKAPIRKAEHDAKQPAQVAA
ncbi:HigA family addiction module antitoxin [Paraburkholderia sp. A2WS-5]|uniref:HigA family addiction module antitoxin n=1 Tax=unclassified Paraburkholderia TaxID=2615204 RepID=UPI003B7D6F09